MDRAVTRESMEGDLEGKDDQPKALLVAHEFKL